MSRFWPFTQDTPYSIAAQYQTEYVGVVQYYSWPASVGLLLNGIDGSPSMKLKQSPFGAFEFHHSNR